MVKLEANGKTNPLTLALVAMQMHAAAPRHLPLMTSLFTIQGDPADIGLDRLADHDQQQRYHQFGQQLVWPGICNSVPRLTESAVKTVSQWVSPMSPTTRTARLGVRR